MTFGRALPPELAALDAIHFDHDDGDGIDYEPFDQFMSAEENANWFRAWTGNPEVAASEFRVFGQDGTGGYAALSLVKQDASLLEQPVVFLGSEGETGVVPRDFADYLWLVAGGYGPMEAVEYAPVDDKPRRDEPEVEALAEKLASRAR